MIHPSAVVALGATIGTGVRVGPWCHVGPDAVIGDGAQLISHVVVDGHTRVGEGVILYPFCTVGLAPQDLKYKGEPTRTEVGARTQVREHVTIHRGTVTGQGVTRVGADCLLMAVVHVAHDCQIGNGVVVANNVVMGGHVSIGDNAVVGGAAAIHQFVRIGRAAMIGGVSGVEADVIPFGSVIGNRARLAGLNVIGLRRRGFDRAQIHALRAAFRLMFKGPGVFAERVAQARATYGHEPLIAEILAFMDAPSKRGLIRSAVVADDDDDDA
ncbi:acyl-ACP--UDP-N-acetylglucosamine O-acyltransferase [Limobrevibacterium gyesilva]|uniref:Acyl-[acyl-carrier-protein]--UDP-N-acetylglucosamine O-acyltransferase n=1 Tax=Limobrevibacterium gyesilva TaxID=2991712 RepID=A0AA42CEF8_9PROT|nr:acyl-ACP--UDP-N-acetylglucosamine O-acyltransferase [Limobrevibacterium gyesilva]MCW3475234.1 acyl-ACP--UDP-N-acetylglucosamine O-acyltransferase [Limobrevibacterium gyesilva]